MRRLGNLNRSIVGYITKWENFNRLMLLILVYETLFSAFIIHYIPYTEIDWIAYMQEVEGWLGGELDYVKLQGDTGPLVYPAGFVYIFSALRSITGRDADSIRVAQFIFMIVYILNLTVVLLIYKRTKPGKPWIVLLLVISKRIHSLFVLRLFNDCIAMIFAYAFVVLLASRRWIWGCALFSLALSVKMNVLLFLPGLLFILVRNVGLLKTVLHLTLILGIQVVLGFPFLSNFPSSYFSRAFEFSRVFQYRWTVNLKFLPEWVFVSKPLAIGLLAGHLVTLVFLCHSRWCRSEGGLIAVVKRCIFSSNKRVSVLWNGAYKDSAKSIVFVLFSSNFIGIVFARTLHYQFYTWYFHSLPFLLWETSLPTPVRLAVMLGIEYAFNVGDASGAANSASSLILQTAHLTCAVGLMFWYEWKRNKGSQKHRQ
jgi:alpha-1,3-mannosyltransferase